MNRLTITIFPLLSCLTIQAFTTIQKDTLWLEPGETFVVKLKIIEKVWEDKCYCPYNGTKCALFYVKISDILYLPANTFLDSGELSRIKYISVPEKYINLISLEKEFTVSLVPSASKNYLSVQRIVRVSINNETEFRYAGQGMYYGSKFVCTKKRPWPIRIFYSRKNKVIILKDPFEEHLRKYSG